MSVADEALLLLKEAIGTIGELITYRGRQMLASIDRVEVNMDLKNGGFRPVTGFTAVLAKDITISPDPIDAELLTIRGKDQKIVKIAEDDISWTFSCVNKDQD